MAWIYFFHISCAGILDIVELYTPFRSNVGIYTYIFLYTFVYIGRTVARRYG